MLEGHFILAARVSIVTGAIIVVGGSVVTGGFLCCLRDNYS